MSRMMKLALLWLSKPSAMLLATLTDARLI